MALSQEERDALVAQWLAEAEAIERVVEEQDELEPGWNYVLGMDPGGTTGIALLRYKDDVLPELVYLHQIENGMEGFYDYFVGSHIQENLVIASEVWVEHQKKGVDRTPMYIQGVQYGFWHGEGLVYQEPAQKSLVPDEYLKENNLWTPGKRHQMDALIHALVYLRNNDHEPTMKSLAGETEEKIAEEGEADEKTLSEPGEGSPSDGEGDEEGSGEGEEADGEAEGEPDGSTSEKGTQPASGGFMKLMKQLEEESKDGQSTNAHVDDVKLVEVESGEDGYGEVEVKGKRKRRERNGVFAGFETETEGIEKELYSD